MIKSTHTITFLLLAVCASLLALLGVYRASADTAAIPATFTIDTTQDRHPISPYIYGSNQTLPAFDNWGALRLGGNRVTGLNWETNASNAGEDWFNSSDNWLCTAQGLSAADCALAGSLAIDLYNEAQTSDAYTLITLQMAGYVAADFDGEVTSTAPSDRWIATEFVKPTAFTYPPDTTDNVVYIDEQVAHYVNTLGTAAAGGIPAYALDNEPALWDNTHPHIYPNEPTAVDLLGRSIALAKAVKDVDGTADIFGPALFGYWSMREMETDFLNNEGAGYDWFVSYYLDKFAEAEAADGRRLLDVLDVHWYPEAQGDGTRIIPFGSGDINTQAVYEARLQAPRSLWDDTYTEEGPVGQWFSADLPIIPRLQQSIDTYYPGTKLAFTEWAYGANDHITGGLASADALGAFGQQNVYMATNWQLGEPNHDFLQAAFQLYRDYDGNRATYGDTNVMADTSDLATSSVYAAEDPAGNLHIIVINKSFTDDLTGTFNITSSTPYQSAFVYGFDENSPAVTERAAATLTNNAFTYDLPPLSAHHFVLMASAITPTPTVTPGGPTATTTPTRTPMPSATPTATPLPAAASVIANGTFATDFTPWWLYGSDDRAITDGAYCISLTDGGTNAWDVGTGQGGITLENGKTYRLQFTASADQTRPIITLVGYRGGTNVDWFDYINRTAVLTTDPQSFSYEFEMTEDTTQASLEFQIGGTDNSTVCLDDISLSPLTDSVPLAVGLSTAAHTPISFAWQLGFVTLLAISLAAVTNRNRLPR